MASPTMKSSSASTTAWFLDFGQREKKALNLITWAGLVSVWCHGTFVKRNKNQLRDYMTTGSGARFSKAPKTFRVTKAIFSSSVSKNGEVYTPETSRVKRISLHIKNMWIQQLCNRKMRDFALALRAREVSGAFEKRAPARLAEIAVWRSRDPG